MTAPSDPLAKGGSFLKTQVSSTPGARIRAGSVSDGERLPRFGLGCWIRRVAGSRSLPNQPEAEVRGREKDHERGDPEPEGGREHQIVGDAGQRKQNAENQSGAARPLADER